MDPVPVSVALGLIFFPIIYNLVFGVLPLESFRRFRRNRRFEIGVRDGQHPEQNDPLEPLRLLRSFALSSERIAERIYSRAGVYLSVGVLIAFSGLFFFYFQTAQQLALPEFLQIRGCLLERRTSEQNKRTQKLGTVCLE